MFHQHSLTAGRTVAVLRRCAVAACVSLASVGASAAAADDPATPASAAAAAVALSIEQVAPGVYVHSGVVAEWAPANAGDIANIGFVVGERCVAVVDTGGTPEIGRRLFAAVRATTPLPVCFVIDTHEHQDHVLGNVAFAGLQPRPSFVAHARFAAALSARETYYLRALQRDFGQTLDHASVVYPDISVRDTLTLDLGQRTLQLRAWPTAHTDNDLTVYDAATKTMFFGDLLFVHHLPVIDGSLRGWLGVLDQLQALDVATVVPGHGPVGHDAMQALGPERSYLRAVLADTRSAIKSGRTLADAVETVAAPSANDWQLIDVYHKRNVTTAFAELEWEN